MIPADQAEKSGLLPDQVKISGKYGGGFPANVEGLHQLHCLVNKAAHCYAIVIALVTATDLNVVPRISFASHFTIILSTITPLPRELLQTRTISSATMSVSIDTQLP